MSNLRKFSEHPAQAEKHLFSFLPQVQELGTKCNTRTMPAETREDGDPAWSPDLPRRLTRIPGKVILLISEDDPAGFYRSPSYPVDPSFT